MTWVEISPESREADHILASHSLNRRTGGPGCPGGDERPASAWSGTAPMTRGSRSPASIMLAPAGRIASSPSGVMI
jgi:hypothetical protein